MKIIDTHTHVFPDNLAAHATGAITVPGFYEPHYNGTLGGLIASMDSFGITQAWTIPVATKAKRRLATAASCHLERCTPMLRILANF